MNTFLLIIVAVLLTWLLYQVLYRIPQRLLRQARQRRSTHRIRRLRTREMKLFLGLDRHQSIERQIREVNKRLEKKSY